ncbi:MAG: DUF92 domain-containing protein [Anaerolineales bacterium]|jgi:uncharacterized protein (TIGR00297 family)
MQITIGILFGVIISIAAWRAGSLTRSGAWAAAITGGLIFGLGGLPWAVLLLTFFVSSSALSQAFKQRKIAVSEKFSKGSQRDWGQVLANGGLGTLLVIAFAFFPEQTWIWFAYAGAMATVNADTWATELGVLNPSHPRLITTGQPMDPGTSGAISLYGTLATTAGAALIGLAGAIFSPTGERLPLVLAATLGGLCGSLFDSLLGATIQAIYHCPQCDKDTERHPLHTCGTETTQIRGWDWLNNDLVNFMASMIGAVVAVIIWVL